jgi:dUTP pyrophosphatase
MKVKFKKLHEGARLPKKATEGSAAYDLYVVKDVIIKPGRQVVPLGFAMEMEEGYEALIDPRSGFSSKGMEGYAMGALIPGYVLSPAHVVGNIPEGVAIKPSRFDCDVIEGKIDADYRDGIGVIVHSRESWKFLIKAGMRIAQMTFHKVETVQWEEAEEHSETNRDGGFGSTGIK